MRTRDPELWWKSIKETSPDEFELRLRSSFRYTIRQYMRNSSIKGIRYVTDRRHPRLVRFCYALVILIATVGMCVLIPVTLSSSGQSSLSVSQELDVFPLSEVDFPAVGLCSSGRISRESRDEYAAYFSIDKNNSVFRATKTGPDEGLQVVIKDNSQDFVRRVRPANDVQIMLFDGNQHPLARAGVIRVYSSGRNSFVFLSLRARMRLADPELAGYEDTWLGCGSRSWSQCISECRARMLRALCLCTPFDQPTQTVCSLEHLECLAKYREKLKYFYPGEDVHESLREEKANAIHCEHCIPNCNVQHYSALMDVVPYGEHSYKIHRDNFMQGLKLMNTSVIRVYFRNSQQEIQVIELNRRWYESLSEYRRLHHEDSPSSPRNTHAQFMRSIISQQPGDVPGWRHGRQSDRADVPLDPAVGEHTSQDTNDTTDRLLEDTVF
ncbi:Sodium channel protein Nach [Danaus plexippus plexippus]|uniref:Sodium channel protein Nach n=1 Tax=Danaus plexippus plexippus TaxID=278856 RepID=A0A212EVY0_DANPL|nr:Sodium channel protein Nach [Danaus plexippus plexippus]